MSSATPTPSVPRVFPASGDYVLRATPRSSVFFEDSRPTDNAGRTIAVCLPGIGDTRRQFRLLAPLLHERLGWRVLLGDLRGFGDSTPSFEHDSSAPYGTYSPESVEADVLQLMRELHGASPASKFVLLGNSLAAGSMVLAAVNATKGSDPATNGIDVQALVLLGPVLRDAPVVATVFRLLAPLLFNSLWGNGAWLGYYRSLYPVRRPADLESELSILEAHLRANKKNIVNVRHFACASKHNVEVAVEALGKLALRVPVVAFLGRKDPDYSNADEEAKWLQAAVPHATISVEDDCGHYPHLEDPEKVFDAIANAVGHASSQ